MNTENLITYLILLMSVVFVIISVTILPNNTLQSPIQTQKAPMQTQNAPMQTQNAPQPLPTLLIPTPTKSHKEPYTPLPQISVKYGKLNTSTQTHTDVETVVAHENQVTQQAQLAKEMETVPSMPSGAIESVEVVCDKGICVRKLKNPFGDETHVKSEETPRLPVQMSSTKPIKVYASNPFNI